MPVYEYICQDCSKVTETWATLDQYRMGLAPTCSHCGSRRLARTFTSLGLLTKSSRQGQGGGGCGPNAGPGCCGR